jgi:L-ascorbate metabolism protein UlaG (beta-lactamase superfamily)
LSRSPARDGVEQSVDQVKPIRTGDVMVEAALHEAELLLAKYPPTSDPGLRRQHLLASLDSILQQENASTVPAVQRFFHQRIEDAVHDMRTTTPRSGAIVWLIYNHGFVVRTPTATVCFDLIRAKYLGDFAISEDLMIKVVEQCDALFVSHAHADHAETLTAQVFISQNKPVIAPAQVGYREPLYTKVTHLPRVEHAVQSLSIKRGRVLLKLVVYPGHQGEGIENNVVLVTTPEGLTVAHTGDQWSRGDDFKWIDQVANRFHVHILLPNDWSYDLARLVRGFNPDVVVPGHANELGHGIEKRQTYAFSYERKAGSRRFGGNSNVGYANPLVVMTWGESYHYERPGSIR